MTHCNDQLIDQLLTQAEQEGRCLVPPSAAIRKALLRRTGGTVVSPIPGLFARKTRWDELNRAQRHCEIIRALAIIHPDWTFCSFSAACLLGLEVSWRHLNVVHVCSSTKPSARPGAHIQRHQIEPAGAIRKAGISVTPPIQTATDCLLQTGFADGMPIADSAISKLGLAPEQLMEAVEQRATARNGRAIRTALTTLRYADARAERRGIGHPSRHDRDGLCARLASIRVDGPLRFGQAHTNGLCLGAPGAGTHAGRARRAHQIYRPDHAGRTHHRRGARCRTTARGAPIALRPPSAALYHERGPLGRNARQKAADGRHPADRSTDMAQRGGPVGAARPRIAGSHPPPIWAVFSQRPRQRKARSILRHDSGTQLPVEGRSGKHDPFRDRIPGRSFRLRLQPENASQAGAIFRDTLSI